MVPWQTRPVPLDLKPPTYRSPLGRALVWLLACLMPLQGLAAGVMTVVGPAHSHTAPARLVLDDFRRDVASTVVRPSHVASVVGHFHGPEATLRHYHPRSDSGVVYASDDGLRQAAADTDDLSLSPSLGAFVAVLPASMAGLAQAPRDVFRAREPWPSLTHAPEPLERPPRPI